MLPIDRLSLDKDRTQQDSESLGVGKATLGMRGGPESLEQGLESESFEKVIDERERPQSLGTQRQRGVTIVGCLTGEHLAYIYSQDAS